MAARTIMFCVMILFGEVFSDCNSDTSCLSEIKDMIDRNGRNVGKTKVLYLNDIVFDESSKNFVFENLSTILKDYEIKHKEKQKQGTRIKVYDLSGLINDFDYKNEEVVRTSALDVTTPQMSKEDAKIQNINQRIQKINEKLLNPKTKIDTSEDYLKVKELDVPKVDSKQQNNTEPQEKETKKIKKLRNKLQQQMIHTNDITKALNSKEKDENNTEYKNNDLKMKINDLKRFDYSDEMPHYDVYTDESFNASDYPNIDYIELYRDTTNEFVPTAAVSLDENTHDYFHYWNDIHLKKKSVIDSPNFSCHGNEAKPIEAVIYPWIAAIFAKNSTHDQFTYICDGALVSEKAVLTAARCLDLNNGSVNASDLIVVLGKKSLQASDANETFYRIQKLIKHENYSQGDNHVTNDLAVLLTETTVKLTDHINTACVIDDEDKENSTVIAAMTTGWKVTGELTTIPFSNDGTECGNDTSICNSYGNDIIFCPSHGGLYLTKLSNNKWYLNGIRSSDTSEKTICTNWNLRYTQLQQFREWIKIYS